ncbi:MAG TPA: hypothetical protein VK037_06935, partial [Pseudogracilibacillus sp.]|nr:hypothetical protein [Pseudogracilibacillus sp.]
APENTFFTEFRCAGRVIAPENAFFTNFRCAGDPAHTKTRFTPTSDAQEVLIKQKRIELFIIRKTQSILLSKARIVPAFFKK